MLNLVFLFVIGTVVGSFLNVCIHRLPRNESIVFPASHCPGCGKRLNALDLLPLIGYGLLGGKCRYCQAHISVRYPLVELLTGLLFAVSAVKFSVFSLSFWFALVFVSLLVIIFFIDQEQLVVPDSLSVGGIFLGLIFNFVRTLAMPRPAGLTPFLSALYGMLLGWTILYLIGALGKLLFKKEAMGEGDLYLGAMLGACLGWQAMLLALFLAYLLAGVVTLGLLAIGKVKLGDYVPFGPALVSGGILAFFLGQQIIAWYLSLFYVV